jgi:uroporphyrinogen-III synthase
MRCRRSAAIRQLVAQLGEHDWLVLTSPYAIENIPADAVRCRVAVVGLPSSRLALERGLRVTLQGKDGTGMSLWSELSGHTVGASRILFPRSELAPVPASIGGTGVEAPVLYTTVPRPFDSARVASVSAAAVTSPWAAAVLAGLDVPPRCASIGPTTSAALRARGVEPWIEAAAPSFPALARSIAAAIDVKASS